MSVGVDRYPPRPVRVLLLVNATASSVTARKRVHDPQAPRVPTRGRGRRDIASRSRRPRLAHAAANDGFDVVAVLAGDGTLNEAADGLLHTDTALAPLPGGSTNVYARTLGYPHGAADAARALLAALDAGSTKRIGVGLANERPFLFNTGIGFDAAVIRRVERYGAGSSAYVVAPAARRRRVETFFRNDGRRTRLDIELDDRRRTRGRPVRDRLEDRPLHVSRAASRSTSRPRRASTPASSLTAFRALERSTLIGGAASAMRTGRVPRAPARRRPPLDDLGHLHHLRRHAVPVSGRRRRRRRHRAARHRVRARRAHGRAAAFRACQAQIRRPGRRRRGAWVMEGRRSQPHRHARAFPITSGTFVMIASTPAVASARASPGSSTVHTLDAHAARRARPRCRSAPRRERGADVGVQPRVPVLGRRLRRGGDVLAAREPPGRDLRRRAPGTRSTALEVERRDRPRRRRARDDRVDAWHARRARSVSASGSHGRHLISTFTISPRHASSASASVGIVGPGRAQRGERHVDDDAEALDLGIVVHDEHAVGGAAHVELHPVGAQLARQRERGEGVLGRGRATRRGGRARAGGAPSARSLRSARRTGTRSIPDAVKALVRPLADRDAPA